MSARKEEIIAIGEITFEQLKRDNADFTAYSPIYNSTYITNYKTKIADAKAIVTTENLIAQGKMITETLYKDVDSLKDPLNKLEGYVKRADNLTIQVKDFGIHEVREKIFSKDVEGLLMKLSTLIGNINDNTTELNTVGYTATAFTALKDLKAKINDENVGQTMQDESQSETVGDNNKIFEELDTTTKDVLDAGKRIYKFTNKIKVGEYTYLKLLSRVRHERNALKTELGQISENCVAYVNCLDGDENGVEGLKVSISEYSLVVETDEDGTAYFESVPTKPTNTVTIVIEGDGWVKQTLVKQKLVGGEDVNLDVVMKEETVSN
jgi:methyl-accepting chemotaxis protein